MATEPRQPRISLYFALLVTAVLILDVFLTFHLRERRVVWHQDTVVMRIIVRELGLSDLALSTEARYTRHPAVSDGVVPFMDHPGAIEHFPSGSFWRPVQ